jgi:hypothetical protein
MDEQLINKIENQATQAIGNLNQESLVVKIISWILMICAAPFFALFYKNAGEKRVKQIYICLAFSNILLFFSENWMKVFLQAGKTDIDVFIIPIFFAFAWMFVIFDYFRVCERERKSKYILSTSMGEARFQKYHHFFQGSRPNLYKFAQVYALILLPPIAFFWKFAPLFSSILLIVFVGTQALILFQSMMMREKILEYRDSKFMAEVMESWNRPTEEEEDNTTGQTETNRLLNLLSVEIDTPEIKRPEPPAAAAQPPDNLRFSEIQ